MTTAKRLTKAQREFFDGVSKEIVSGVMFLALGEEDFNEVKDLIDQADLSELTEQVGQRYLEQISFTEIKRIDKFTKSDEYRKVQTVGAEVGTAVQEVLVESIQGIIAARFAK